MGKHLAFPTRNPSLHPIEQWFAGRGWQPFGSFTGSTTVQRGDHDRLFVITDDAVLEATGERL